MTDDLTRLQRSLRAVLDALRSCESDPSRWHGGGGAGDWAEHLEQAEDLLKELKQRKIPHLRAVTQAEVYGEGVRTHMVPRWKKELERRQLTKTAPGSEAVRGVVALRIAQSPCTSDEVAAAVALPASVAVAHIEELERLGRVRDSGQRRNGAVVWERVRQ